MTVEKLTNLAFQLKRLEEEGKDMSSLRGEIWNRIFEEIDNSADQQECQKDQD